MLAPRLLELIRHFPETGVRFLVENARNATGPIGAGAGCSASQGRVPENRTALVSQG
jgi:hypothetical protein